MSVLVFAVLPAARVASGTGATAPGEPPHAAADARDTVRAEWDRHFQEMKTIIANGGYLYRPRFLDHVEKVDPGLAARGIGNAHTASALDKEAFYHATDKDPLDIVLRRTGALLMYLSKLPDWKGRGGGYPERLEAIALQAAAAPDEAARKAAYLEVCAIRRRLALSNPLLNFDKLLIGSRADWRNCVGMSWAAGKGFWIVHEPFGDTPRIVNIFEGKAIARGRYAGQPLTKGVFSSLELSFDAKRILFAWCPKVPNIMVFWDPDNVYHIFEADIDGSNCVQLTDGPFPDMDPCYLPSGRIAFTSYRRSPDRIDMHIRCISGAPSVYTLHSCAADGGDIVTMSYHDLPEYSPSVDHDGRIVFTRWDYYDKASHWTGNLWSVNPDGRDPRAPHGNYFFPHQTFDRSLPNGRGTGMGNPQMEQGIRAVPGRPGLYTAAASAVHGGERGSLILIDTNKEDDYGMGQVSRLTPEMVLPESEFNSMDYGLGKDVYGYCWPLDRDFYLCSYGSHVYYMDRFGNRELIVAFGEVPGAQYGLVDPIPLRPRPRPPVIPEATYEGQRNKLPHPPAAIRIMNIYDSDLPWPPKVAEERRIKWLRVIQFFPKNNDRHAPFYLSGHYGALGYAANADYGNTNNCRMPLGVVPVEDDGSACFYAPIRKDIFFQALDGDGMAIQSMRSATYVQAGEQLTCQGCHESKWRANQTTGRPPKAMRRAPSVLAAEVPDGAVPFSFDRLVKPVFDNTSVPCHVKQTGAGSRRGPTEAAYGRLRGYVFCNTAPRSAGGLACMGSRTIPGHYGALACRMGQAMVNPTHQAARKAGVISPEDFRRIVLWLDCNSARFGTVYSRKLVAAQMRGEIAFPAVDFQPWDPLGLEIHHGDGTPPSAVPDLHAVPVPGFPPRVELSWTPAEGRGSAVGCYAIYRDGEFHAWSLRPTFDDSHPIRRQHVYQVAPVNRSGKEGPKSAPVTATCHWDPAWPPRTLQWDPEVMKATASSGGQRGAWSTVNGSGLDQDGRCHGNDGRGQMWTSARQAVSAAWIQYDLGCEYHLLGLRIWNYNGRNATDCGIKEADILVSSDAVNWASAAKNAVFPESDGTAAYAGFELRFEKGVTARHVKVAVKTNHGGQAVGLSEMRFHYGLVPEEHD